MYGAIGASNLRREVPVAGILGDRQAATFGQAAFGKGESKNTYGTGNFLIVTTCDEIASRRTACSPQSRTSWGRAQRTTRSRSRSQSPGRSSSGFATTSGSSRTPQTSRHSRAPSTTTAASNSSPPSLDCSPRMEAGRPWRHPRTHSFRQQRPHRPRSAGVCRVPNS